MKTPIVPRRYVKPWGEEWWLSSPLAGRATTTRAGAPVDFGPLVKIITTHAPLSVQVHPDAALAARLEGTAAGKSEAWYVLRAAPGNTNVVGLRSYAPATIKRLLATHQFLQNLITQEFKVGDFINIPAGLVHGLGAHMQVLEIQTPADFTYRYYDYERRDANGQRRPLHLAKALQAQRPLSPALTPVNTSPLTYCVAAGCVSFHHQAQLVKGPALVINLTRFGATIITGKERVRYAHYAVITPPPGETWTSPLLS